MADVFSRQVRSEVMRAVRGAGNPSTEQRLRSLFSRHAISGWRRQSNLPGRPDFVFPRSKVAVFVDGCFWHGCPLHGQQPKQNAQYWRTKIARNRARDRWVTRTLRASGWRVLRIWEHALSCQGEQRLLARIRRVLAT